ncbi:MAG: recombination protein RecR [Spirochaetes bacterium DG_61]|nr:MAG: recombination protein RecR [Spirochaetes bacterium DG_61]
MDGKSALSRLVGELSRFPGVGRKTAERLAFYILKDSRENVTRLAEALLDVKTKMRFCRICANITEGEECEICVNPHRNHRLICVVEEPKDIWAIEKSGGFSGIYHVLMGVLSPLDGIGPENLRIRELLSRVQGTQVDEIIIATDPNVEGDATAIYLSKLLKPLGVNVTRIASGLPAGGDLEYADSLTLSKALAGRRPL